MTTLLQTLERTEKLLAELTVQGASAGLGLHDEISALSQQLNSFKLATLAQLVEAAETSDASQRLPRLAQALTAVQQIRLRLIKPGPIPASTSEEALPSQRLVLTGSQERGKLVFSAPHLLEDGQSVEYYGRLLVSSNELVRTWAADKLVDFKDAAVPVLFDQAMHWTGCIARLAILALEAIGTPLAIDSLVRLAGKANLKRLLIESLVRLGDDAIPALLNKDGGKNEAQREVMAQSLWWIEKGTERPRLAELLPQMPASSKLRQEYELYLKCLDYLYQDFKTTPSWLRPAGSYIPATDNQISHAMLAMIRGTEDPEQRDKLYELAEFHFYNAASIVTFLWGSGLEQPLRDFCTEKLKTMAGRKNGSYGHYQSAGLAYLGNLSTVRLFLELPNPQWYDEPLAKLVGILLDGSLTPLALEKYGQERYGTTWKSALEKLNDPATKDKI
jgi:hypothetical protein